MGTSVSVPGSCPQAGEGACSTRAAVEAGGGQVTPCQAVGCTVDGKEWILVGEYQRLLHLLPTAYLFSVLINIINAIISHQMF